MSENNQMYYNAKTGKWSGVDKTKFLERTQISTELLGSVERKISIKGSVITINFTPVGNGLYLSSNDFQVIFEVSRQTIESHLNNIYGDYLNFKETENLSLMSFRVAENLCYPKVTENLCHLNVIENLYDPNDNMIIKVMPIQTNGGTQNVGFYHHDILIELASRINTFNSRLIKNWVNNIIHEYQKDGFVINKNFLLDPNNSSYLGKFLTNVNSVVSANRKLENISWARLMNSTLRSSKYYIKLPPNEQEYITRYFQDICLIHCFGYTANDIRNNIIEKSNNKFDLFYIDVEEKDFDKVFNCKNFLDDKLLMVLVNFYEKLLAFMSTGVRGFENVSIEDIKSMFMDNFNRSSNIKFDKYSAEREIKSFISDTDLLEKIKNIIEKL